MKKLSRQAKARKVIIITTRRMISNLLDLKPKTLKGHRLFEDAEACALIRDIYQINNQQPDRLSRAYDLADVIR
jgi:hypothetical protein